MTVNELIEKLKTFPPEATVTGFHEDEEKYVQKFRIHVSKYQLDIYSDPRFTNLVGEIKLDE